jgi:hypothetical protein
MTTAQVGQVAVETLRTDTAVTAQVGQMAVEVLRADTGPSAQLGQVVVETLRTSGLPGAVLYQLAIELMRSNIVNPCARTGRRTPWLFIPTANPGDIIIVDPSGNPTPVDPNTIQPAAGQVVMVVTNGFNVEIPNFDEDGIRVASFILDPAGTLAVGTLTMPSAPTHKWLLSISSTQTISSLTLNPNTGQTISNAVTTLAAGVPVRYQINLKYSPDRWFPA